jgi:hypothetical protein
LKNLSGKQDLMSVLPLGKTLTHPMKPRHPSKVALYSCRGFFCAFLLPSRAQTQDATAPNFVAFKSVPSRANASTAQSASALLKVQEDSVAGLFKPDQVAQGKILAGYGKPPLSFEANHGQTDERVKFLSRGPGYILFLTSGEALLTLRKTSSQNSDFSTVRVPAPDANKTAVLKMQLLGTNPASTVSGLMKCPARATTSSAMIRNGGRMLQITRRFATRGAIVGRSPRQPSAVPICGLPIAPRPKF